MKHWGLGLEDTKACIIKEKKERNPTRCTNDHPPTDGTAVLRLASLLLNLALWPESHPSRYSKALA